MTKDKHRLCRITDITDNTAKGFTIELEGINRDIFLVRTGTDVFGYFNRCPHTGVNLDWMPDELMDITGKLIQCSTHGALFRIHDGFCCYGPCAGDSLSPVDLVIENDEIFVDLQQISGAGDAPARPIIE